MRRNTEPVRLRERTMPSGNISLYLDYYYNGVRKYEYLHLYLIPEHSREDKDKNRQTKLLAETIRSKRLVEYRNGIYGFEKGSSAGDVDFFDYFEYVMTMCGQKKTKTTRIWSTCLNHLRQYHPRDIPVSMVDRDFITGFKHYLDKVEACNKQKKPLSDNTKNIYLSKVTAALNTAVKEGVIASNPSSSVSKYKAYTNEKVYLTTEEIGRLIHTRMTNDVLRRAFLFACFTGLRFIDVKRLKWGNVGKAGDFTRIVFKQKKTGGQEYLDICVQAEEYLGKRMPKDVEVFHGLNYSVHLTEALRKWAKDAGIDKPITFHSSRHSFAIMMLNLDTDIYTVSKLLGHANLASTQIYARIVDKKKQEAISKIPRI
jgi:integrase